MSVDASPAPRAGRRALTRQSPCDLRSDSSSSRGSSSTGSIIQTASHCVSAGHSPVRMQMLSPCDSRSIKSKASMSTTPDDEACFVDVQQRQVDFIALLPSELATYILSLLPHHSDVLSCTYVSRAWYSLCRDPQIWKALFEKRASDGWRLVRTMEERWEAIQKKLFTSGEESFSSAPLVTPSKRRGKAVQVDENPLQPRLSARGGEAGDISMDSVESTLTRASIYSQHDYSNGIDYFAIYQARFLLTKRWSLKDGEPEPATLDSSWGINSYSSTASGSGPWSTNEHDEIALQVPENCPRDEHSFTLIDKHLEGHTDSVYCVRFDHRPFNMPVEVERSLQDQARSGPLYDPRTSLGLGSYGRILSGSRDRTIRVWDGDSGICLHTLKGHNGSVLCMEYDDDYLFSASSDMTVIIWDLKVMERGFTPMSIKRLRGHGAAILDLAINNDWLITCGRDTTVRVYDRKRDYQLTRIYTQHDGPINAGSLNIHSADNKTRAVTASGEGGVQLWDVETGTLIRSFVGHAKGLACVKFIGKQIVTGSNDETIRVWDADTGECLCVCQGHVDLVRAIGFDPHRKLILSGGYDGKVKLFYVGREIHPNAVLASGGNLTRPLWDFESGFKTRVLDVQMDVTRILCCGEYNKVSVRDFGRGSLLMKLFD